jgi:hypothetical protein
MLTLQAFLRQTVVFSAILTAAMASAETVVITGPPGSELFGQRRALLPNGNIVVVDERFDLPSGILDAGAVRVYRPDGSLLSTLTGRVSSDNIGSNGVAVLTNGNFVVLSEQWKNTAGVQVGAATWVSGQLGLSGAVSESNSLIGTGRFELFSLSVIALSNGHYLVLSPNWSSNGVQGAGAVTWGNGLTGIVGTISTTNSFVGGHPFDRVASVVPLSNGNYVLTGAAWNNERGAVTLGNGLGGTVGVHDPSRSLVGNVPGDKVGRSVTALKNGNFVVSSPDWDNLGADQAGAVTWGSGTAGVSGVIDASNSLVGTAANQRVGDDAITLLSDSDYVVKSPLWDNGSTLNVGAATFGRGDAPITGVVSAANSLVGTSASDRVGATVVPLTNGSYVVVAEGWDSSGVLDVGAATFGSGTSGISGPVSAGNSLVGSQNGDGFGLRAFALTNGNYVVSAGFWDHGTTVNAGAVSWASGTTGRTGAFSAATALHGSRSEDRVGQVVALRNGNYVVASPLWDESATLTDVGAVTWADGSSGRAGPVAAANSLLGSTASDRVGIATTALSNGNYVISSPNFSDGPRARVGAATWASGSAARVGRVSLNNSLIGATANDGDGMSITALSNGNYLLAAARFDRAGAVDSGAVAFALGTIGRAGLLSASNALLGSAAGDFVGLPSVFPDGRYAVSSFSFDGPPVDAGAVTFGRLAGTVGDITTSNSVIGEVSNQLAEVSYDQDRLQMIVYMRGSNRIVLYRPGTRSTTSLLSSSPNPSVPGQPVTVVARVSHPSGAPTAGAVVFTASDRSSCRDAGGTTVAVNVAEFSCTISFPTTGTLGVSAEYLSNSETIDGSLSGLIVHTVGTLPDLVFRNGFQ